VCGMLGEEVVSVGVGVGVRVRVRVRFREERYSVIPSHHHVPCMQPSHSHHVRRT